MSRRCAPGCADPRTRVPGRASRQCAARGDRRCERGGLSPTGLGLLAGAATYRCTSWLRTRDDGGRGLAIALPEAVHETREFTGLITALGFLTARTLSSLET